MPPVTLGPPIPILHVRHIEEALNYYVERLGFAIDFRYEKDPTRYAGVRRDTTRLHLHRAAEEHFRNGNGTHTRFRIPVSDPEALYDEYRIMGVLDDDVHLRDTEWGTREFAFRDLDGNGLTFFRIL